MSALPSQAWTKPFLIRGILRSLLEAPSSSQDRSSRHTTAKGFYSTSLILDNPPSQLASRLAQRQAYPSTPLNNVNFEELSEEYLQGEDGLVIPQTSPHTLNLCNDVACETEIHTAEQQPHPSARIDTVVFETLSEEYLEDNHVAAPAPLQSPVAATSTSPRIRAHWARSHRVMHRTTGLKPLFVSGDFARAESLRVELRDAGIHIKRDMIYAEAALHAWQIKPVEERTECFYEWFTLMPNASLGRIRRGRIALNHVRKKLFSEPSDLNTIACFGLVAARKGFANYVSIDIITHIARFASPGVSSAFFDEFEKSARSFHSRFHRLTKEDSSFSLWNAEKWHNTFIRALCFAGYMDAAVDRLSHILERVQSIRVAPFTWSVLLEILTELQRADLIGVVRELRTTAIRDDVPVPDVEYTRKPEIDSPSAGHLARLVDEYIDSGRTEDLEDLRREMQSSARPDLWVTTQMKFYLDRRQYIVVLRQFMQYYACIGVPKELVIPYIQDGSLWLNGKSDEVHRSLPIVSPPMDSWGANRWPSTHTITIVWQSLVSLSEDLQSIRELYHSFLDYWDRYRPSTSLERPSISSEIPITSIRFQYPPVMGPDTVHFHIFIVAFARLAGPEAAMQVLVDMQARDIRPDGHNWTVLAGHYAGQDGVASAERILGRMETTLTDDQTTPASSSARTDKTRTLAGPVSRPAGWIPGPNLVTYTAILRGLVDRGRIEEAKQFEERMKAAGYISGSDERTETVLELLRRREGSARVSWQERAHWQPEGLR